MRTKNTCTYFLLAAVLAGLLAPGARSQQMSSFDRGRALDMLTTVAKDVEKHYYDSSFHGVDWDAKVAGEKQRIQHETSLNMSLSHIAAALDALNDSHTFFLPPSRPYRHDFGVQTQMIGSQCYVARVRPGSDAEVKGIKPGDAVLSINGYAPDRENLWKMDFVHNVLRPQPGLRLGLQNPEGRQRQVDVAAKVHQLQRVTDLTGEGIWDIIRDMEYEEHLMRARYAEVSDGLMILKLPEFDFSAAEVDNMIGKARKHQALIIDLRGNPGGTVETLKYLVGDTFESEVKIADRVGRKESKPEVAKSRGHNAYTGKLVVLVDSKSASAAELFARLVQLEKRGTVLGDRSSGSVMEAKQYSYRSGYETEVFYGASITEFDLVMSDGKSLEHTGVTPDELVLPTGADLASGRDPVLSRAAARLGAKLSPEDAGKMFPYEWPKE